MSILVAKGDYWIGKGLARKRLAEDLAGKGHGTFFNGTTFVDESRAGSKCGSIQFDGVVDYINLNSSAELLSFGTAGDFSIAAAVKTSFSGAVWSYGYAQHGFGRFTLFSDRVIVYDPTVPTYVTVISTLALDGKWHLIRGVYSRSQGAIFFYVDGVLQGQSAWSGNMEPEEADKFIIGGTYKNPTTVNNKFNGIMADVSIWNTEKNDDLVPIGHEDNLVGYWPLADRCPVLISSHPYRDTTLGQAQPRIPAGSDPEFRSAIAWPQHNQRAQLSYGALRAIAIDGQLDHFLSGTFRGRPFELRTADRPDQPWEETELHYKAYVESVKWIGERFFELEFRNPAKLLQNPIQINQFDATTPVEDLRGRTKPMIVGIAEHVPAHLYDEVGIDDEHWYVADNYNGSWAGDGQSIHAVNEGLAEIVEGASAGQFEYTADGRGVLLHKHPTLPVTIGWARGPRRRLIPWLYAHFGAWVQGAVAEQPDGYTITGEVDSGTGERWIRRFEDSDSILVHQSDPGSSVSLRTVDDAIPGAGDYTLRIRIASVAGYSGRVRLIIQGAFSDRCDVMIVADHEIDQPGTYDYPFLTECDLPRGITFGFLQHPDDDTAGDPSRVRVLSVQVLQNGTADDPWDVPHIGTTPDQIVPYLALERGVRVEDGVEIGPLRASEIDYDDLAELGTRYPQISLGWWWRDETTHEKMFDRIAHTFNSVWFFDREGKLRFAEFRLPEELLDEPIEIANYNHGGEQQINIDPAPDLSARIGIRKNFNPMTSGDVANSVDSAIRNRYGRDWIQTVSADSAVIDDLHPDYDRARGAEARETMIATDADVADVATDLVQPYTDRRFVTALERLSGGHYEVAIPGDPVKLSTRRFQIGEDGRLMIAVDVRHLPVTGRLQITAWS